jgi:hypothetical protein
MIGGGFLQLIASATMISGWRLNDSCLPAAPHLTWGHLPSAVSRAQLDSPFSQHQPACAPLRLGPQAAELALVCCKILHLDTEHRW